jgi:hypothetical protein
MSKNLLDNGTVLTLGLVGAVAAIGVAAKRGVYGSRSTATSSVMERLMRQLNGHGSRFEMEDDYLIVDDDANVSIVAVDSPLRPDAQGQYRPGVDEAVEPTMVEVAKRKLDRSGNLVGMKVLGQFSAHDATGIARALSSHRAGSMKGSRSRGSRALAKIGVRVKGDVMTYTGAHGQQLVLRKPGLPNLDAMSESELMSLWHATYIGGFTVARFLFPSRPKDYVRTTRSIGGWASNKATAMKCRASGDTHGEEIYENIAASIYRDLPAYARWK